MNWFGRMLARFGGFSTEGLETTRVFGGGSTSAGVFVDEDRALKNATVWACTTYLARIVAQLPAQVLLDQGDASPKRMPRHPVRYLLHTRPNPEMSAFVFRETMMGYAVRWGNGVAEIVTDARNVPVQLWPLHPSRVTFERDQDSGEMLFGVRGSGRSSNNEKRWLKSSEVFHLRGFGEGSVGLDVISYAAESIGWAQATQIFGSTFFGNGLNASGFLTVPGKMTREGKDALDAELESRHGGSKKGNKVMILDAQMKFEKSSVEPESAQFIETRYHQIEEICRWFGVPPHKVMHMLRSTFSNIEHQSIEVVVDSITPWALRFEQEADFKLFGANRQGYCVKLDMKGLLRGDFKSRQEGLQLMRRNGVINANDWCRLEDMDEIGPQGDKYIVEGNMTTLDQVGKVAPVAQPPKTPDPENMDNAPEETSALERAREQAQRAALH